MMVVTNDKRMDTRHFALRLGEREREREKEREMLIGRRLEITHWGLQRALVVRVRTEVVMNSYVSFVFIFPQRGV